MHENHCFLDGSAGPAQNGFMTDSQALTARILLGAIVAALLSISTLATAQADGSGKSKKPPVIYWCPDRPADQQIAAGPERGCAPLVDTKPASTQADQARQNALVPIKIDQIQSESTQFLRRYNDFLDCCIDDVTELSRVKDLQAESANLLKSIQSSGLYHAGMAVRQYTLGEIVRQVAQSHRDLTTLRGRLEHLDKATNALDGLDPAAAAAEARRLDDERDALTKEFRPKRPASSARTGMGIQDTTVPTRYGESPTGGSTLHSVTGDEIGERSNLETRPGDSIRDTTLSDRYGSATETTTLRSSTGFGIGQSQNSGGSSTTPTRVGPDLGDSSLNR